jgi:hypothetical protein
MKRIKRLLAALGILLGLGVAAYAQTIINQAPGPTDTVTVSVKGPGGTGYPTTIQALRNATGYTLAAAGTTVNTSASQASSKLLATGAITTWNITLPSPAFDGEDVAVACPGGSATVSLGVLGTQTLVGTAFTACTSGGVAANTAEYIYSTSANTWYRVQ